MRSVATRSPTPRRTGDRRQGVAPFEALERRTLMSLSPAGEPFRVNAPEDFFDFLPDVAMDADGDSVAAWFHINEDFESGYPAARLFDADGNPKGPQFQLNDPAVEVENPPYVAMDDAGNFAAVWAYNGLEARLFDAAGNPRGPAIRVDDDVPGAAGIGGLPPTDLAFGADGSLTVVWKHNDEANRPLIYLRRYDAAGNPLGGSVRVDDPAGGTHSRMDPQVAVTDKGDVLVAWRGYESVNPAGNLYGRVFAGGTAAGGQFVIDAGGEHGTPSVSADRNSFVVAWRDAAGPDAPQSILARRYNANGHAQGEPILVDTASARASVFYGGPYVEAATDGRFAVTWSVPQAGPDPLYLRQYGADGTAETGVVQAGTRVGSDGLGGFGADDDLSHGMVIWSNDDFYVEAQFLTDPAAGAAAADAEDESDDAAATALLTA